MNDLRNFAFTPAAMPLPQAAFYIGVSVSTLERIIAEPKSPLRKRFIKTVPVVRRSDLDAYLDTLPLTKGGGS
jgi:hypothetical protein